MGYGISEFAFIISFYRLFTFCDSREVKASKTNYAKNFAIDF